MTRLERLEDYGWKIIHNLYGGTVFAKKNNGPTTIKGTSVTDLHKQIIGY